jgi:hypothetical protein
MKLHGLTIGSILLCLGVAGVGAAGCTATASGAAGTTSGSGSGGSGSGGTGTPQPTVSDFPNCTADSSLACDPSAIGITCPGGTSPDSSQFDCSIPETNSDGTDSYCCITFSAGGSCAPDNTVTCPDPLSYGFTCTTPGDTPDTFDCTLNCSVDQGTGAFCCTDNGVCSTSSSGSGSGGGSCASDSTLACDAGSDGVDCPAGVAPDASFGICSDPSPQADGTDGYCCVTATFTDCVQDDSVTAACDFPSFGFSCSPGSPDPSTDDPSLTCSAPATLPDGNDGYCCQ